MLQRRTNSPKAPKTGKEAFDAAIRAQDEALDRLDIAIWVGGEPTFTDRHSESTEWLSEALGAPKEECARRMLAMFRESLGGIVLRTVGRQYPKEDHPRWSFGLYRRRDGNPLWSGPQDPLLGGGICRPAQLKAFWKLLTKYLRAAGWPAVRIKIEKPLGRRIIFRRDDQYFESDPKQDPRLARPAIDSRALPLEGLHDELALTGTFLIAIGYHHEKNHQGNSIRIARLELPAFTRVDFFLEFLSIAARAATEARLNGLVLSGFPPPVDATVSWTTFTPDPGVLEINMAPAPDTLAFLKWSRRIFEVAEGAGLSPYRLHYNGQVADSGGSGQLTLGGPNPASSPFLKYPSLLPELIRYFNRHPSLSFYFASDFIGSTSQSPRPDERLPESVQELSLALQLLARQDPLESETLWSSLAPFLADLLGNSHRSEINIEKLWNPYLPGRGCLGLVEFRAFRMPPTPEKAAALAALLRGLAAMLIGRAASTGSLIDWGSELHDRFALPFYLRLDLAEVLQDLRAAGLGLAQPIADELLDDGYYQLGSTTFRNCRLTVRRALEFWPLIGDSASQEFRGSRLVDASSARIEITIRPLAGSQKAISGWSLTAAGCRLPLRLEQDGEGPALVFGLRYRRYQPTYGLHPLLGAHGPIEMILFHSQFDDAIKVTLHEWKPQGGGYTGLPADLDEARRRREERIVVEPLAVLPESATQEPPAHALTPYCLDLRRL